MQSKNIYCPRKRPNLIQAFNQLMQKLNKNKRKQSPEPFIKIEQKSIQKTKSIKRHAYFEANNNFFEKKQKISQRKSEGSEFSEVLSQLASYMKQKNSQVPWNKRYNWEQMLVDDNCSQKSNVTKTAIKKVKNDDEKELEDFFAEFEYLSSIKKEKEQQEKKQRQQDSFTSRTQSMASTQTYVLSPHHSKRKRLIKNSEKKSHKSRSSSNSSSSLMDFLIKNNKVTQTQPNFVPQMRRRKNYIDDDENEEFQDLIAMINQAEKKKKLRLSNEEKKESGLTGRMHESPVRRGGNLLQINNPFLHLKSPHSPRTSSHKRTTIIATSHQKNSNSHHPFSNNCNKKSQEFKCRRLRKQKQDDPTCSICLCQIEEKSKLPCKHSFCRTCLMDWLAKTSNCPNCRKNAEYYTFNGQQFQIEQKAYSLQNYVDNIGEDDSNGQGSLDMQCYNCDDTNEGDELLVCDKCFVNAVHHLCDPALRRRMPPDHTPWFCHMCRMSPMEWYREQRVGDEDDDGDFQI